MWPQKQQLQHPGAFQERAVASEAAVTAQQWQQQQHLQLHNQRLEEEQEQQPYSGEWKRGLCEPSENKNLMRTKKGRAGLISISNANTICEKKNIAYRSLGR